MLQRLVKCGWVRCSEVIDKATSPNKTYCSNRCSKLALHKLVEHAELVFTAECVNELGAGMALVRFGITHPRSEVVRWFPGARRELSRPGFSLPMINLPYDLLPGSGLYNLAFYGADQKLAYQPQVRVMVQMPASRGVRFSEGVQCLWKELPR